MPDFDRTDFQKIYDELKNELKDHQKNLQEGSDERRQYQRFTEQLKSLNQLIKFYSTPDSHGVYPSLNEKEPDKEQTGVQKLITAYQEVKSTASQFLKLEGTGAGIPQAKQLVRKLNQAMSRDLRVLDAYSPEKEEASLPILMDRARVRTVDLTDYRDQLKTAHGAISSRIPFQFTDPGGKELKGFFTRKSVLDIERDFNKALDDAKKKHPSAAGTLDQFVEYLRLQAEKGTGQKIPDISENRQMLIYNFLYDSIDSEHLVINKMSLYDALCACRKNLVKEEIEKNPEEIDYFEDLDQLSETLSQPLFSIYSSAYVNGKHGIKNGDRVDTRNSAMSAVADLLGNKELLARSIPMKVKIGDEIIEGTFMEQATGVDPLHISKENVKAADYKEENFKGTGLKAMADLQVLDFICGNVDRHFGNMMYQFDDEDELTGVQGIDNDLSFGTDVPKDRNQGFKELSSINNMKVISESMAASVLNLTPEALRFRLQGLELKEKQIKAACSRLKMLQTAIKEDSLYYEQKKRETEDEFNKLKDKPRKERSTRDQERYQELRLIQEKSWSEPNRIRIVPDDGFRWLVPSELAVPEKEAGVHHKNIFNCVNMFINEHRIVDGEREIKLTEIDDRSRVSAASTEKYAARAEQMFKSMAQVTKNNKTSEEFEALRNSMERYKNFCQDNRGEILDITGVMNRNAYLKEIQAKCDAYLEHKKGSFPTPYANARVRLVKEMKRYAAESAFVPNEKEKAQIRANEQAKIARFNVKMNRETMASKPEAPKKTAAKVK